jgi:uncharacterized protein (TIGR02246 family)
MQALIPADVDRLFARALSAGDVDAALALYAEDACYVSSDGSTARGHAEIRAVLEDLVALRATLDCYDIDVVENGDTAVLRARWSFAGIERDGTAFETRGRSVEVVRRQADGCWLFVIDLPHGAT